MGLLSAVTILRVTMMLYVVGAALSVALLVTPGTLQSQQAESAVVAFSVVSACFGLVSLLIIYRKDREYFPFVFGLALGLGAINRGLADMPREELDASTFFQVASLMPAVVAALVFHNAVRRQKRMAQTL